MFFASAQYATGRAMVMTIIVLVTVSVVQGSQMSSGNFQIQSDSVNVGGGYGSSSSYRMESTVGEVATGNSSSSNFAMRAGYQQMQEVYISLSTIDDVVMSPAIAGLTGGVASGTTSFVVVTDSPAGYAMTIQSANNPAMQSGIGSIANYVPAGGVPDYTFATNAGEAHFGFSVEGNDTALRFRDNGVACGVGSNDTVDTCYDPLTTTDTLIAEGNASNHPTGATTTLRFKVGVGANAGVLADLYTATSTVTVLPL